MVLPIHWCDHLLETSSSWHVFKQFDINFSRRNLGGGLEQAWLCFAPLQFWDHVNWYVGQGGLPRIRSNQILSSGSTHSQLKWLLMVLVVLKGSWGSFTVGEQDYTSYLSYHHHDGTVFPVDLTHFPSASACVCANIGAVSPTSTHPNSTSLSVCLFGWFWRFKLSIPSWFGHDLAH